MLATEALIEKINALPAHRVAEVEDFVDFIRLRDHDRALVRSAAEASAPAFAAVWDNPKDAAYDRADTGAQLSEVLARLDAVRERIGPLPGPPSTERLRWDRDRDDRALFEPEA